MKKNLKIIFLITGIIFLTLFTTNIYADDDGFLEEYDISCEDIFLEESNFSFELEENKIYLKEIEIKNESRKYDFEITNISISNNSLINTRIKYPETINKRTSEKIEIEFQTKEIDRNKIFSLDLTIEGDYILERIYRDRRIRLNCDIKEKIQIEIINTTKPSTDCSDIYVFAPTIRQEGNLSKNYSIDNGFYVYNKTNQRFNIEDLIVTSTTTQATISTKTTGDVVYSKSTHPLAFNLSTKDIPITKEETLRIRLRGRFDDNTYCYFSDITKETDLRLLSPEERCSQVGMESKIVLQGRNNIVFYNNTPETFYIESFLVDNKHNLQATFHNQNPTIFRQDTKEVPISFTGTGSLEILFKGRFSDGHVCEYSHTSGNVFHGRKTDYRLDVGHECLFDLKAPTVFEVKDYFEALRFSFINNTHKGGKITITGQGLVINPAVINLSGYDDFTESITLSNFNNPKAIYYKVELTGCPSQTFFTNITEKIEFSQRIDLISFPKRITPEDKDVFVSLELKNNYNTQENVTIKLSGFPNTWQTQQKNVVIDPRSTTSTTLNMKIDDFAEEKEYQGFIEVYKFDEIVAREQLTIDLIKEEEKININHTIKRLEEFRYAYSLVLDIKNKSGVEKTLNLNFVDFLEETIIEGPSTITLAENQKTEVNFRIVTSQSLSKEDIKLRVVDSLTNQVLEEIELTIDEEKTPIMAGFMVLGSTQNVLLILVLIIAIIVIVNIKKKKNKK